MCTTRKSFLLNRIKAVVRRHLYVQFLGASATVGCYTVQAVAALKNNTATIGAYTKFADAFVLKISDGLRATTYRLAVNVVTPVGRTEVIQIAIFIPGRVAFLCLAIGHRLEGIVLRIVYRNTAVSRAGISFAYKAAVTVYVSNVTPVGRRRGAQSKGIHDSFWRATTYGYFKYFSTAFHLAKQAA